MRSPTIVKPSRSCRCCSNRKCNNWDCVPKGSACFNPAMSARHAALVRLNHRPLPCSAQARSINLAPQRPHWRPERPLLTQPPTHAGSQAAPWRKRRQMGLGDPRREWCVIANCGTNTAPPATTLNGEPLEQWVYQHAQRLRSQYPTQQMSMMAKAEARTPRPAPKIDTHLG